MKDLSDLVTCFEDQWASCSLLLRDMSSEERKAAAFKIINDPLIASFLPSEPSRPPRDITPPPTPPLEVKKELINDKMLNPKRKVSKRNKLPSSMVKVEPNQESFLSSGNVKSEFLVNSSDSKRVHNRQTVYSKMKIKKEPREFGKKMRRKSFTVSQCSAMAGFFQESAYPGKDEKDRLALELGLTNRQVSYWFHNKRTVLGMMKFKGKMFTPEQLSELNRRFDENHFPRKNEREEIEATTGVKESKVRYWFNSRRLVQGIRKPKKIQLVDLERKPRVTKVQSTMMEKMFQEQGLLDREKRKDLAAQLQLTNIQVKLWFQNRQRKATREMVGM